MLQTSSIESSQAELDQFYQTLETKELSPLWTAPDVGTGHKPKSRAVPHRWRWADIRPLALRATELVGTKQAERRVLRLLNPAIKGRTATTNTLFAGIQIVMPGEVARAHRHTPSALRLVIEGVGGYTNVNGEPLAMLPGDLVLTPNWTWHDHANTTNQPMIWLDGLDVPLVNLLESAVFEDYSAETQPLSEAQGLSLLKHGAGPLQPAWERPTARHSPLMHYPWPQAKAALDSLSGMNAGSPFDGVILEYTNPATGGPCMPTMACFIQLLRPGERTQAHKHNSGAIYHAVQGRGVTEVDGQDMEWTDKDVFCVPGWATHHHRNLSATEPAYLFSFTDQPVLRALDLYREEE
ncbi:MAG: cupin domain-containing protein [Chloroflexota bacterium]